MTWESYPNRAASIPRFGLTSSEEAPYRRRRECAIVPEGDWKGFAFRFPSAVRRTARMCHRHSFAMTLLPSEAVGRCSFIRRGLSDQSLKFYCVVEL